MLINYVLSHYKISNTDASIQKSSLNYNFNLYAKYHSEQCSKMSQRSTEIYLWVTVLKADTLFAGKLLKWVTMSNVNGRYADIAIWVYIFVKNSITLPTLFHYRLQGTWDDKMTFSQKVSQYDAFSSSFTSFSLKSGFSEEQNRTRHT